MSKFDIVILILVGLGGLSCFRAGFTRSVWGIAAISGGIFAASRLWQEFVPMLESFVKHEELAKWISIIAIAAGVSIALDMVFDRLQAIMDRGILGWINNMMGAAFGVVSSGILLGLLLLLLDQYGGDMLRTEIADSRLAPTLRDAGNHVLNFGKGIIGEQVSRI